MQAHAGIYSSEPALMHFYIGDGALDLQPQLTTPSCFGQMDGAITLQPTGAFAPFIYHWEDGSTEDHQLNLGAGAYAVTLTAADGCTLQDTVFLPEPDLLSLSLAVPLDTICPNSGQIQALVSGGTTPYAYDWSNGATQANLTGLAAGTYQLAVEDANGCASLAAVTLVQQDTLFSFQEEVACAGEMINVAGTNYTADTSFCLNYQSMMGCDSIHCVTLQFLDTIRVTSAIELCPGESYMINGLTLSQDTTLCWVNPSSNGCDSTYCLSLNVLDEATPLAASICPGDGYFFAGRDRTEPGLYRDTLAGSRGCDSIVQLQLSFLPAPQVEWRTDGSFCTQATVTLDPGLHSRYLWSTGAITPGIVATAPGTYQVTVENAQGCTSTEAITLSSNDLSFAAITEAPLCAGEASGSLMVTNLLGGVSPYLYALGDQPFQPNPVFGQLKAGTYRLLVEDAEGCQSEQLITLSDPPAIGLVPPMDATISLGDTIPLVAAAQQSNLLVHWSPPEGLRCNDCLVTDAFPTHTTRYLLAVTDANGCQEQAQVLLQVDRTLGLFIPNALSPNDDGINDRLVIQTDASVRRLSDLQIFNRWGVQVYEQASPRPGQESWDGKFRDQLQPSGVYVYQLKVERVDGVVETISGALLIVR